jgi:hypothetical protein
MGCSRPIQAGPSLRWRGWGSNPRPRDCQPVLGPFPTCADLVHSASDLRFCRWSSVALDDHLRTSCGPLADFLRTAVASRLVRDFVGGSTLGLEADSSPMRGERRGGDVAIEGRRRLRGQGTPGAVEICEELCVLIVRPEQVAGNDLVNREDRVHPLALDQLLRGNGAARNPATARAGRGGNVTHLRPVLNV